MKIAKFACVLAAVVLSACDGTTLPADTRLVGRWQSTEAAIVVGFPEGVRTVSGVAEVRFGADGEFHRDVRLFDPARTDAVIDVVEEGTFTARNGKLTTHVERGYYRGDGAPATNVTLQPTDRDDKYTYSIEGGGMTLVPVCPPNALCIEPRFLHYSLRIDP